MKSVIVDITHIPHINLFKNVIKKLEEKGVNVDIVCLDRGKNFVIAKEEYPKLRIYKIGKHRGNILSIIFEAQIIRLIKLIIFLYSRKYNIGISAGSFILGFALKLYGIPNIQLQDDPENKKNLILQLLSADGLFYPNIKNLPSKVKRFNALKEWSYLSPKYFSPNESVLFENDLVKKEYIFVRDVAVSSTNYRGQDEDLISRIASKFPKEYKVVLSLEKKNNIHKFPSNWIILKEPVRDIHSIIYFSRIVVSSGDSVAREGAMLGVPSIYCGKRNMQANIILSNKKMLFHVSSDKIPEFLHKIIQGNILTFEQDKFRELLLQEWIDVNEFIIEKIYEYWRDK